MLFPHLQADRPLEQKLDLDRIIPAEQATYIVPEVEPAKLFCDRRIALFDERVQQPRQER